MFSETKLYNCCVLPYTVTLHALMTFGYFIETESVIGRIRQDKETDERTDERARPVMRPIILG